MAETPQGGQPNRNNNRNRQGGNRNRNNNNRGGNNRQGGNRNNNGNRGPRQGGNKKPAPKPLTFWQKVLGFIGLGPKKPAIQPAKKNTQNKPAAQPAKKRPQNKKSGDVAASRQPQRVEVESGRLYVGNLSYEATEYDLEDLFKGIGGVKGVEIIYNRHTHKSKGYGFIEMRQTEDAKRAVEVLHDQPFMGRKLIVNGAKGRREEDNTDRSAGTV